MSHCHPCVSSILLVYCLKSRHGLCLDAAAAESVTQLFAQYGEVVMVRICSRGSTGKLPAWLNKAVEAINISWGQGEFALIEFGTEEECVHCVVKTKNPDNWWVDPAVVPQAGPNVTAT